MADPHVVEDEQVTKLKEWWKENGMSISVGVGLGLTAIVGYNWWQSYTETRAETASTMFENLVSQVQDEQIDAAQETGQLLIADYQATPYAANAALMLAKVAAEQDDLPQAENHLRWIIDNSDSAGIVHAARLRLGNVLIAQEKYDEAMSLLSVENTTGFSSQYHELKGDIFAAKSEFKKAAQEYQSSIDTLLDGSGYNDILDMKLNDVRRD